MARVEGAIACPSDTGPSDAGPSKGGGGGTDESGGDGDEGGGGAASVGADGVITSPYSSEPSRYCCSGETFE
jgi:hypothetical protein